MAVAGLRRLHRGRQFLPAALGASGDLLAGAGDFRLVRVAAEHAASAVEQDLGAVVEVQGGLVDAADRGDAERAGDDRDVAGGAAAGGAEAQDAGAVDRGDVGGSQVFGDQDGVLRDFDLLLLDPGEQAEDAPADIADVGGALAQQGIVEAFQLLGVAGEGFAPGIGGAGAARYAVERQIDEVGVFEEFLVGVQDLRLGGVAHVPLQLFDLGAGLGQGGVELAALVGGGAALLVHFDHVVAVLEDLADGETGGGRDAGDLVGVGRRRRGLVVGAVSAAGCGSSPGFSPQPSAIREARDATALSASGPLALTVTTSPCLVDRPMIATRDLALTLSLPRIRWICELKVLAAPASTAAGLACRPAGFGRGMPSDCASAPGAAASATVIPAAPCPSGAVLQRQFQDDAAAGFDHPGCGGHAGDALDVGDDDLGQQAAGVAGDAVRVEPDDGLADLDLVADLDAGREAVAAQHHGIKADMDQDFDAFLGRDREGVVGVVELGHGAGDRRQQFVRDGVQGDPVSHHLLGENGIGHLIQGHEDTGKRRNDPKIGQGGCHGRCPESGTGCSLLPERGSTRKALALEPFRKCSGACRSSVRPRHGDGGVGHAVREAPLVVVPGQDTDQIAVDDLGLVQGEDRRMRIVVEVG